MQVNAMGSSPRAELCYGYHLGGTEGGWLIAEADEHGGWPGVADPAEKVDSAANTVQGLSMEFTGSYDYSGCILSAHTEVVSWGEVASFDWHPLDVQRVAEDWDGKLARVIERLGVTPVSSDEDGRKPVGPSWLLAAFYG